MIRRCTKSRSFKIYNETNVCKEQLILEKATIILEYKNLLSNNICKDFLSFIELTKFDFIKKYNHLNPKNISGQEAQKAMEDVFISYDNKKDTFIRNTKYKIQKETQIEYYERNTKKNTIGEQKSYEIVFHETKLTKVCTYLAKYYNETALEHLKNKIKENENSLDKKSLEQVTFYKEILHYINKFGQRIINLALNKQDLILKQITKHPIDFSSLTFRSVNRIKHDIISKNKNIHSKYNAFLTLGGYGLNGKRTNICIPTKYSYEFHGAINKYTLKLNKEGKEKEAWDTAYTIVFEGKKPIKCVIAIDSEEDIPTEKFNVIGMDTNTKNNLFYFSDNTMIDYDRELIKDFCDYIKRIDEQQKIKKRNNGNITQNYSNKQLRNRKFLQKKIKGMLQRKCNKVIKKLKSMGKDHLVIENLGKFAMCFSMSEEFHGIKYTRLISLLNLADLKNMLESIGNKHGIQVTIIDPHYTSITCSRCGNIDKKNRKSQEEFVCTECGYEANADYNASQNILNRVIRDVLRSNLLVKNEYGYAMRKVGKQVVKDSVRESYSTLKDDRVNIFKV